MNDVTVKISTIVWLLYQYSHKIIITVRITKHDICGCYSFSLNGIHDARVAQVALIQQRCRSQRLLGKTALMILPVKGGVRRSQ
jgi:hypothetical protein